MFKDRARLLKNVTVIIPVYNDVDILPYLKPCISDLNSKYVQVIIVDDCSDDCSYFELNSFVKENCLLNTKVFRNDVNRGVSYSRNMGIKKSIGEYIAFLDSDDDWHPQKIDIQIDMMKKFDIKICGTSHQALSREGLDIKKSFDYKKLNNIPFAYVKWPKILFVTPFSTPSVIIHHSLKIYLFDEMFRYAEDYNLWKRITYRNKAIKILLPLTYTFKHDYNSDVHSLSSDLKAMQLGVEKSFMKILTMDDFSIFYKAFVFIALYFSKLKYIRRLMKIKK